MGGITLLWWGRIGKLVAFVAALFAVADAIGYEKIRDFEDKLHTDVRSTLTSLAKTLNELKGPLIGLVAALGIVAYVVFYILTEGPEEYARGLVCGSESEVISSACSKQEQWHYFWQFTPVYIGSLLFAAGLVLLAYIFLTFIIPELLVKPLAWLLRILPRWAKVLNLVLIVVGFHFDLLAS
jgi:hypothetical protein